MSFNRIWATFLRYLYFFTKMETMSELFYWPVIEILMWGITGIWLQSADRSLSLVGLAFLTAILFWQIVWRSSYEITMGLLQEYWHRNLVNLFSTPLKISEWLMGTALLGIFKILITIVFSSIVIFLCFGLNVYTVGWMFIPCGILLTLSGWSLGLFTSSIMAYYGQRLQMLAWMTPFVIAPFSAIFYPLSALPSWLQKVSHCLPTTYVFEVMRGILYQTPAPANYLYISAGLNLFYLILSGCFFYYMFEKSRQKGLARLE